MTSHHVDDHYDDDRFSVSIDINGVEEIRLSHEDAYDVFDVSYMKWQRTRTRLPLEELLAILDHGEEYLLWDVDPDPKDQADDEEDEE
ncbi:hypothetical protein E3E12_07875 [Formicincola oecophyllae]|uniref:Uncharacterized protein n=1 Tax=Formicincola oecophyllae TaxID=2558361 RepID=A0A4Y6UA83_9PROT|nr:hypothetical protein [Formicincola oecophyllae]QDH14114.1 hypothetical protein E3E12_07875 [Formicincola oecophyllae]